MGGFLEYKELRELTAQSAVILGQHWTALVAGCSVCTVQTWLRRRNAQVWRRTTQLCLPRLRQWWDAVPAFLETQEQIRLMQADESNTLGALLSEFGALSSTEAARRYSAQELAYGCEASVGWMNMWSKGQANPDHRPELIRAVAHLRQLQRWPAPRRLPEGFDDAQVLEAAAVEEESHA